MRENLQLSGIKNIYIQKYPFNKLGKYCDMSNTYDEVCGGVLKEKDYILTSDDFILRTDIYRFIWI